MPYGAALRVLVTGGNRYIGLHLVLELARQGHEVTVVNSHEAPLPEGARRIHADRTQPGALLEALGPVRDDFDAVYDNGLSRLVGWFDREGRDRFAYDFA